MRNLRLVRFLPHLVVTVTTATTTVGPAHAYTPPIGTDKGSLTVTPAAHPNQFIMFDHNYDISSPY